MKWRQRLASIAVVLLLSHCATRPVLPPPQVIDQPAPQSFKLTGRAFVKHARGGEYIRFMWQTQPEQDTIELHSPIGTYVAKIVITPQQALLHQSGQVWQATDAEQLMEKLLTWTLPIKGLRYWLLGVAAPGIPAQWKPQTAGWHLMQSGWSLYFSDYREVKYQSNIYRVPKRIEAIHNILGMKIVVGEWQLGVGCDE